MEFLRIQKGRNRQVLKRYSLVRPRRDVIYIFRKSSDFERLAWAHVVTLFSAHRKRIDGRPPSPKSYGERERGRDDRRPRSCSLSLFCRSSVAVRHDTRPRCWSSSRLACRPECCVVVCLHFGRRIDNIGSRGAGLGSGSAPATATAEGD